MDTQSNFDFDFDFDVDNYTDSELIQLLDIPTDTDTYTDIPTDTDIPTYTDTDISTHANTYNFNQHKLRQHINNLRFTKFINQPSIINFLNNVETRLLDNNINNINNIDNLNIFNNNNIETQKEAFTNLQDSNNVIIREDQIQEQEQELEQQQQQQQQDQDTSLIISISNELLYKKINFIYYHFNTLFRANSIQSLNTDCEFIIPSQIYNVSQIRLASIKLKRPYLISEIKSNNKFNIEFYNNDNKLYKTYNIVLPNGYYNNILDLSENINKLLQHHDISYIGYTIEQYSNKSNFKLDLHNKPIDLSYIKLDFYTYYTGQHSLARIIGYNDKLHKITGDGINIYSTSSVSITLTDIYFCLDEYQSNIVETHRIVLTRNMLTQKVLCKINIDDFNKNNIFEINEVYSSTKRFDTVRYYTGLINITKFAIKIVDNFGNIVNQDQDSPIEFTIEFKINETVLREL